MLLRLTLWKSPGTMTSSVFPRQCDWSRISFACILAIRSSLFIFGTSLNFKDPRFSIGRVISNRLKPIRDVRQSGRDLHPHILARFRCPNHQTSPNKLKFTKVRKLFREQPSAARAARSSWYSASVWVRRFQTTCT